MTTTVISAFFLPLLYGLAGFIAIIIPLTYLQNFFKYVDQVIEYMKSISQSFSAQGFAVPDLATIASGLMNLWGIGDLIGSIYKFGGMLFVLPFAMIIGFLAATGIIMKAGGWIAGYIGGISTSGDWSNPLAAGAARLWGGAAAGAVGGVANAAGGAAARAAGSATQAVGGAAGSAATGLGGAIRTLGATAAISSGGVRPAPALNLGTAGVQRTGSFGSGVGPGGAQVSATSPRTSPTISPAAASLIQNRAISMASPDFCALQAGLQSALCADFDARACEPNLQPTAARPSARTIMKALALAVFYLFAGAGCTGAILECRGDRRIHQRRPALGVAGGSGVARQSGRRGAAGGTARARRAGAFTDRGRIRARRRELLVEFARERRALARDQNGARL